MMLGIESGSRSSIEDHGSKGDPESENNPATTKNVALKSTLTIVERSLFAIFSVGTSMLVPDFSSLMAFLGAFTSFLLCVIGPISAKIALTGQCKFWDVLILSIAVVMAVWGTCAAFWSV